MLYITPRAYAHALQVDKHTAYRHLKTLPRQTGPRGEGFYPLIAAMTSDKKYKHLHRLFEGATDRPRLPQGTDPERLCDRFEIWLRKDPRDSNAINRLRTLRKSYGQHLADAVESSALLRHLNYLQNILPLDNEVLRYVITGNADNLPAPFKKWCLQHAIQHFKPQQQEAA